MLNDQQCTRKQKAAYRSSPWSRTSRRIWEARRLRMEVLRITSRRSQSLRPICQHCLRRSPRRISTGKRIEVMRMFHHRCLPVQTLLGRRYGHSSQLNHWRTKEEDCTIRRGKGGLFKKNLIFTLLKNLTNVGYRNMGDRITPQHSWKDLSSVHSWSIDHLGALSSKKS
jgi:hypothetical protein